MARAKRSLRMVIDTSAFINLVSHMETVSIPGLMEVPLKVIS